MLQVNSDMLNENLKKIVGMDDSTFSRFDLATLIRNKYGRSYDVQLNKKVFTLTSELTCRILLEFCMTNLAYNIRHWSPKLVQIY